MNILQRLYHGTILGLTTAAMPAIADPAAVADNDDTRAIECTDCSSWNAAQAPIHLHGRTWYIGPAGLSVLVIDTGDGLVLIDGGLPQSVPGVVANLSALGLAIDQVRWIVNSHAHFDHAGGIAALQRLSGARVAASPRGAEALRLGEVTADDPLAGDDPVFLRFPPVKDVVELADGETIVLGDLVLTAHHTPGHTPGGTSWSWRSCVSDSDCADLVFVDSLTPVSGPDFRFGADPQALVAFRRSLDKVANLPCDLLVTSHPWASSLFQRAGGEDRSELINPEACAALSRQSARTLDQRLQRESSAD